MKKRYISILIIAAVFVFGMLIWRFWKQSIFDVISFDAASISDVSASAMIADFESRKTSSFLLDDEEVEEILRILDKTEYRRDYRNLLPWRVRDLSSDNHHDGRTLMVMFSDGDRAVQLQIMSSSLMLVNSNEKTNTQIHHPVNENVFNELKEYFAMDRFNRKEQPELTEAQKKWNKLWDMYGTGELAETDYNTYVLCDYDGGVNGEGHSGWFFNTENTEGKDAITQNLSALKEILPAHLYDNLEQAFHSYGTEDEDDVCESADDYFYEHEQEIIEYLQGVADRLEP